MAILKHFAVKNADYGAVIDYLKYQHDEFHLVPILDENGNSMLRDEFYFDGLNCNPEAFDLECELLNQQYHKNQRYDEIKCHHYIISHDPMDVTDHGLTGEQAQAMISDGAAEAIKEDNAMSVFFMDFDMAPSAIWARDLYDLQEFLTDEERNGKEEEEPAVVLPETKPEPEPDVEIEEPEQDDGKLTKILAIVFVLGVGGAGAFFYFYIYKPKQSEPEVSKENLEYEALPTKNEDEQDAETEE